MKQIKINTKFIGGKGFKSIKSSVSTVELAEDLQIELLELNKINLTDGDELEAAKKMRQVTRDMMEFLQKVLKYSDDEIQEIADSITMDELSYYVSYVVARVQGASEPEAEKALTAAENSNEDKEENFQEAKN